MPSTGFVSWACRSANGTSKPRQKRTGRKEVTTEAPSVFGNLVPRFPHTSGESGTVIAADVRLQLHDGSQRRFQEPLWREMNPLPIALEAPDVIHPFFHHQHDRLVESHGGSFFFKK